MEDFVDQRPPKSVEHFSILRPLYNFSDVRHYQPGKQDVTCYRPQRPINHLLQPANGTTKLSFSKRMNQVDGIEIADFPDVDFMDVPDAVDHLYNPCDEQKIKAIEYLLESTHRDPSISHQIRNFGGVHRLCYLLRTHQPKMISLLTDILLNITTGDDQQDNIEIVLQSRMNLICFAEYLKLSDDFRTKILKILHNLSSNRNSCDSFYNILIGPFEGIISTFIGESRRYTAKYSLSGGNEFSDHVELIFDCFLNYLRRDNMNKLYLMTRISLLTLLLDALRSSVESGNIPTFVISRIFDIFIALSEDFDSAVFESEEKGDIFSCSNVRRRKGQFTDNQQAMFWLTEVHETFCFILSRKSPIYVISCVLQVCINLARQNNMFTKFYMQQIRNSDGLLLIITCMELQCDEVVMKTLFLLTILVKDKANRTLVGLFGLKHLLLCLRNVVGVDQSVENDHICGLVLSLLVKIFKISPNYDIEKNFIHRGGIKVLVTLRKNENLAKKIDQILSSFQSNKKLKGDILRSEFIGREIKSHQHLNRLESVGSYNNLRHSRRGFILP